MEAYASCVCGRVSIARVKPNSLIENFIQNFKKITKDVLQNIFVLQLGMALLLAPASFSFSSFALSRLVLLLPLAQVEGLIATPPCLAASGGECLLSWLCGLGRR